MEAGDPFQIVRHFWAASNIAQNPDDPRDWEALPADVMDHVMEGLSKPTVANLRLVCKTWHRCVNSNVSNLELRAWPTQSSFLAAFTSVTSLHLNCGAMPQHEQPSNTPNPLFLHIAQLPKLQQLSLTHPGLVSLANLELLTNLTTLEISRAPEPGSSVRTGRLAGYPLDGAVQDLEQLNNDPEFDPAAPLYVPAIEAIEEHNNLPGSSSSSSEARCEHAALPDGVRKLLLLETLVLEGIAPEPAVLAQLKQLKKLELRGRTPRESNGVLVSTSPLPGLGRLSGLTSLVAKCNYGISRLPPDIGQLVGLKHLDVSKNMLWGLPAEMTCLSSLQHLDVSSNCLAALPDEISALTALTQLDASNNSRVVLPQGISRLCSLKVLHLSWIWSDLGVLWEGSRGLSSLEVLNVVGNGLAELPDTVGGFKALSHLSLAMNNLSSLPDSLSRLTSLTSLELSDNRLSGLPAGMCRLSGLASLSLRSNCLADLPHQIGDLTSITYLDASMNHIPSIPDSLTMLTQLNQLALSMNPLVSLPSGLSALKNLKILEMYYVRLEGGTSATEIGLSKLQQLIPGLYIFSNTMFPHEEEESPTAAAESEQQQQYQPAAVAVVDGISPYDVEVEDLSLLLSPSGRSRTAAAADAAAGAPGSSVFSRVSAASSSSNGNSSSGYGMSGTSVFGINGSSISPSSSSSSLAAAAAAAPLTRRTLFSDLSLSDAAVAAVMDVSSNHGDDNDRDLDMIKSPGKDQQYRLDLDLDRDQHQLLLPTGSSGSNSSSSSSRVTFAPDVIAHNAAASSSSGSPMDWCAATAAAWPHLAAAAANQPSHLQGAWSCDLSMIAAATAAADASAAAASDLDVVMPLRPLPKAHSVGRLNTGRPRLSRYSRGGEATNSPTSSSGYGLAARYLGNAQQIGAGSSTASAQSASPAAAAAAVMDSGSASARAARRWTYYDD